MINGEDQIMSTLTGDQPGADVTGVDTHVPMKHPDGGSCDLYEVDADGVMLVPANDVPLMVDHGFAIVTGDE